MKRKFTKLKKVGAFRKVRLQPCKRKLLQVNCNFVNLLKEEEEK